MRWILTAVLAVTMASAVQAQNAQRGSSRPWTSVRVGVATVPVPPDWEVKEENGGVLMSPPGVTRRLPSGDTEFDLAVMVGRLPKQGPFAGANQAAADRIFQEFAAKEYGTPRRAARSVTVSGRPATMVVYAVPNYPREEQRITLVDVPEADELLLLTTSGQPALMSNHDAALQRIYTVQFASSGRSTTRSTPVTEPATPATPAAQAAAGRAPKVVCRTSLPVGGASTVVSCNSMRIEQFGDRFVLKDLCHGLTENFDTRMCTRGNVNGSNGVLPHYDYDSLVENEWLTPMSFTNANLPMRVRRVGNQVTFEGLSNSDMSLRRLTAVGDSAIEHSRVVDSPLAASQATMVPAGWTRVGLGRVSVGVPERWTTAKRSFEQPPVEAQRRGARALGIEFYAITDPRGEGYLFGWRKAPWGLDHSTLRTEARQHVLEVANFYNLDPIEPIVEVKERHGVEIAYTFYHAPDRSAVMVATVLESKMVYWFMFFNALQNEAFIDRVLETVAVEPLPFIEATKVAPPPAPVVLEGVWEIRDAGTALVIGPAQTQNGRISRSFAYTTTNGGTRGIVIERGDTLIFGSQSCTQKRENDVFLGYHVLTLDCQSGGALPGRLRLLKNIQR
jgi:hypothetical protein